jgi:hypothetical protein
VRTLLVIGEDRGAAEALGAGLGYAPSDVVLYSGMESIAPLDPHRTRVETAPGYPVRQRLTDDEISALASWQCCGAGHDTHHGPRR